MIYCPDSKVIMRAILESLDHFEEYLKAKYDLEGQTGKEFEDFQAFMMWTKGRYIGGGKYTIGELESIARQRKGIEII